jgi:hypothetical protein
MTSTDRAWVTLGLGVIGWNLMCEEGCTFSERMDEWLTAHPVATRAGVLVLTAHLINAVPNRLDPVHWGFVALRRIRR